MNLEKKKKDEERKEEGEKEKGETKTILAGDALSPPL